MQSATSGQGWLHFLLADPYVIGTVAWIGLTVTVAGFAVAIQQIRRVKTSAQAAAVSVKQLVGVVRLQERSARMSEALMQIRSSQDRIKQSSYEAAAAHLNAGWLATIAARELCDELEERELISDYVVSIRRIFDTLDDPQAAGLAMEETAQQQYKDLSRIHSGLSEMAIRLSAHLAGIGGQS